MVLHRTAIHHQLVLTVAIAQLIVLHGTANTTRNNHFPVCENKQIHKRSYFSFQSQRFIYTNFWPRNAFASVEQSVRRRTLVQEVPGSIPCRVNPIMVRKKFDVGGFSNMVILDPQTSTLKVWVVWCFGKDFLFKPILTGCGIVSIRLVIFFFFFTPSCNSFLKCFDSFLESWLT